MSQFAFLQREWADVYDAAVGAEAAAHRDPRVSCFYARRALELAVSKDLFDEAGVEWLVATVESIKRTAAAA